jgi:hypothetical protein
VKALFQVACLSIDQDRKAMIEGELRAEAGSNSKLLTVSLPPPSSNSSKWWETHTARYIPPVKGSNPFFDFGDESPPRPVYSHNLIDVGHPPKIPKRPEAVSGPLINLLD